MLAVRYCRMVQINENMATRIVYTKDFKERVLTEIEKGVDIEEVSKRYEVPVVVVEEWRKRKETEAYVSAVFLDHSEDHTSKLTSVKDTLNTVGAWVKARALMGGLLTGCLCVAALTFVFNGSAEFSPKVDPKVDIAAKLDSLIIQGSRIEKSISSQNELPMSISNTVTNLHANQKPKVIVRGSGKVMPTPKSCCCYKGTGCSQNVKCEKDSIR